MIRLQWSKIEPVLQTIWAGIWYHAFTYAGILTGLILMAKLFLSSYWWLGNLYVLWILFDKKPSRGGRMLFEHAICLDWYRSYFPIKLIKTVDLDPSKNYILANYPHGTFAVGTVHATVTNSNFRKLFPGLTPRLIMHNYFFYVPFFREFLQLFAIVDSSEQSIKYILNEDRYKGTCAVIVVGGAREALESEPGKHRLVFNKRKGYIRIAIQTGASIVPLYSFGETDIFGKTAYDNLLLYRFQQWLLNTTRATFVKLDGRGPLGLFPRKKPVNVVVGSPLHVEKNPNPSKEEINVVQAQFKKKLIELFEAEKSKYIENYENTHLEFI